MNRIKRILAIVIIYFLFTEALKAQSKGLPSGAKSIYIEVLPLKSMSTLFTANFDYRINKKQNGLGVDGGVGIIKSLIGGNTFYLPFGVNTLVGKRGPNYFEGGLKIMPIIFSKYYNNKVQISLLPSIGYRFQPLNYGITLRAFGAPFVNFKGSTFLTGGLSLGYKF